MRIMDESRLWKYWASEEMANSITYRKGGEFVTINGYYVFGDNVKHTNYLSQLLKKEWFR